MGNIQLNSDTLPQYYPYLQQWHKYLTPDADILLYGCNVASVNGAAFVKQLSELTQANLAASTNLTGSADQGGNWDLGFRIGKIKSPLAFTLTTLH